MTTYANEVGNKLFYKFRVFAPLIHLIIYLLTVLMLIILLLIISPLCGLVLAGIITWIFGSTDSGSVFPWVTYSIFGDIIFLILLGIYTGWYEIKHF